MIDAPEKTGRLLTRLQAALPVSARPTLELAATLRAQNPARELPSVCSVASASYVGDKGGIVCGLDFGSETASAVYVSITNLRFDPRLPVAREIAAYQKHRVKRLSRQQP